MRLIDEHALVIAGKGTVIDGELYIKVDDLNKCLDKAEVVQPQGIDKDRLIEELKKELHDAKAWCKNSQADKGVCIGLAKAIEIANQQPTSDGWIPVSERLPKNGQRVLTIETLSWDSPNDRCVREAYYYKEKFDYYSGWEGEGFYRERNSCHEDYHYSKIGKVHAWQPLPQPYKESE